MGRGGPPQPDFHVFLLFFAALGVLLAWLDVATELRGRVVYAGALVIFCSIVTYAIKVARSRVLSQQAN